MQTCPCGSEKNYSDCCEIYISHKQSAPTAESLMRSRYTAYSLANVEYIAETMKSPALDGFDLEEARAWAKQVTWLKLEVLNAKQHRDEGMVEFRAYFTQDNAQKVIHEISDFILEDGKWFYVNGIHPTEKVGRNDMCSCGSNKKYKKCCGQY